MAESSLKMEKMKKLKVLKKWRHIVLTLLHEKASFIKLLQIKSNKLHSKCHQYVNWRLRYNSPEYQSGAYGQAFDDLDQLVGKLAWTHVEINSQLHGAWDRFGYFHDFLQQQLKTIGRSIGYARKAASIQQLNTLWTPPKNWKRSFPDPKLEEYGDEWDRLKLMKELNGHLRQKMPLIRQLLRSNSIMYSYRI